MLFNQEIFYFGLSPNSLSLPKLALLSDSDSDVLAMVEKADCCFLDNDCPMWAGLERNLDRLVIFKKEVRCFLLCQIK